MSPMPAQCRHNSGTTPVPGTIDNTQLKNNIWSSVAVDINDLSGGGIVATANLINPSQPMTFVNADAGDFHLQANSPAIDQGLTLGEPYNVDFDGILRPQGSAYDIGAYEFVSVPPILPTTSPPSSTSSPPSTSTSTSTTTTSSSTTPSTPTTSSTTATTTSSSTTSSSTTPSTVTSNTVPSSPSPTQSPIVSLAKFNFLYDVILSLLIVVLVVSFTFDC